MVYLDTNIYIKALKDPPEQWQDCARTMMNAAEDGDIQLAASTFLLVELTVIRGAIPEKDRSRARAVQAKLVDEFLPKVGVTLGELDSATVALTREINERYPKLYGADLVHLATAVRLGSGYFFTFNTRDFPIGEVVKGVSVSLPKLVWDPKLDDVTVEWPADA